MNSLSSNRLRKSPLTSVQLETTTWDIIPEHVPHFGGIWEAIVKSFKTHFTHVTTYVKLTFEELTTIQDLSK